MFFNCKLCMLILISLMMVQCGPSWSQADKKIEEGDEYGASQILTKLAQDGDQDAINWLAEYYSSLLITSDSATIDNLRAAEPWLKARAKSSESKYMAAQLYKIYTTVPGLKNEKEAKKWAFVAANKGDVPSMALIGHDYLSNGDYDHAIPMLEKAVTSKDNLIADDAGKRDAAQDLYSIYSKEGSKYFDTSKAMKYGEIAASKGSRICKNIMAYNYFFGEGVTVNLSKAYHFISDIPDNEVPVAGLKGKIIAAYEAEKKANEAKAAMDKLKKIESVLSNSGWICNMGQGHTKQIFFGGNMTVIFKESDVYNDIRYSVSLKYSLVKSSLQNLEPELKFYKIIDAESISRSSAEDLFDDTYIVFSVNGNEISVRGNTTMSGEYTIK